jgi:hypothetical protein
MSDYAKGFKDGFAAGLEEGKKIVEEQWRQDRIKTIEKSIPEPYRWPSTSPGIAFGFKETCPKCGIKIGGAMNYTCSSVNCPIFYKSTCEISKPMTGAATYNLNGVTTHDIGYNDGPREPIDYSMR